MYHFNLETKTRTVRCPKLPRYYLSRLYFKEAADAALTDMEKCCFHWVMKQMKHCMYTNGTVALHCLLVDGRAGGVGWGGRSQYGSA